MALPFDLNIYDYVFEEILKVQTTGDPINDSVYLILLPMAVLYLFISETVKKSRFGSTSIRLIIMFVIGFFIVREGFYPLFASFSLPLLGIIMLWHAGSFILGGKSDKGETAGEKEARKVSQLGSGAEHGGLVESVSRLLRAPGQFARGMKEASDKLTLKNIKDAEATLRSIDKEYRERKEEILKAQHGDRRDEHTGDYINSLKRLQMDLVTRAENIRVQFNLDKEQMKSWAPKISNEELGII